MGDKILLTAKDRTIIGKKVRQLRKEGLVPAVMYGPSVSPKAVVASASAATRVWRDAGKHKPVEVTVGTTKRLTMIKSADMHPVKHTLRHLSFHIIKQNEKVDTEVPLKLQGIGETPAEKAGYVILQALETVQIQALPAKLPDAIYAPGEKLAEAGDSLTVADITPVDGVTVIAEPDVVIATVYEPSALAAQNDAAGGTATDESEVETEVGSELAEGEAQDADGKQPKGTVEEPKEKE